MKARQDGIALIGLLALIVLGASWWLVSALATPANRVASDRAHNAKVLAEAKAALIGWVAMNTASTTENNPGRLPCPETPVQIGTANEGLDPPRVGIPVCSAAAGPVIGRLPWKALGIDQLRDAANQPLWYVVTTGTWALQNSVGSTVINSNSVGQLNVDGVANAAVALIIAPGSPLNVQASANCTALLQQRGAPGPAIDFRNYLECQNASSPADLTFATSGPAGSFNDQVLTVTLEDVMPVIEAAIADRFERTIAPQVRSAYSNSDAANPNPSWPVQMVLPFAAPFGDPTASNFQGNAASTKGLLPISFSETFPGSGVACNPAVDGIRCNPTFVSWTNAALAGPQINSSDCGGTTATQINCTYYRRCFLFCGASNLAFTLTANASNVGMALRQLNNAATMTNVNAAGRASSGVINNNGSATITLTGQASAAGGAGFGGLLGDLLCGVLGFLQVCKQESIAVPIRLLADHPVLNANTANFNWFFRNNWHQVSYYVVAPDIAPSGPRACGANCLTVNFRTPVAGQRGLMVISGPSLTATARPNGNLLDWLEGTNCDLVGAVCNPDNVFAVRSPTHMVTRTFNDRIAAIQ